MTIKSVLKATCDPGLFSESRLSHLQSPSKRPFPASNERWTLEKIDQEQKMETEVLMRLPECSFELVFF